MTDGVLAALTPDEIRLLGAAAASIEIDEPAGEAMHLRVRPGGRSWVVENARGQVVLDIADPEARAHVGPIAVSERVRRFADCFDRDTVTLSLVDDRTVLAVSGTTSAAIDVVASSASAPAEWTVALTAAVTVDADTFLGLLWCARCMPSGLGEQQYPMPPMWMQLGGGELALHVDWTDFLDSRATYRMDVESHQGTATVAVPHAVLENFLRVAIAYDATEPQPLVIEVGQVRIDDEVREALVLSSACWRLGVWTVDALADRWGAKVVHALLEGGVEIEDADTNEWVVRHAGHPARVKLHHRTPDVARVSAVVVHGVGESVDLLRELSALNAAATGIRYWLEDGTVHAAADVRCTALQTLAPVVHEVARSAAALSPMLAALTSPAPPPKRRPRAR